MIRETFTLEPAAAAAKPPFSYGYVPRRVGAFWVLRGASGRHVGKADTRRGARAGVKVLYAAHAQAQHDAPSNPYPMKGAA